MFLNCLCVKNSFVNAFPEMTRQDSISQRSVIWYSQFKCNKREIDIIITSLLCWSVIIEPAVSKMCRFLTIN